MGNGQPITINSFSFVKLSKSDGGKKARAPETPHSMCVIITKVLTLFLYSLFHSIRFIVHVITGNILLETTFNSLMLMLLSDERPIRMMEAIKNEQYIDWLQSHMFCNLSKGKRCSVLCVNFVSRRKKKCHNMPCTLYPVFMLFILYSVYYSMFTMFSTTNFHSINSNKWMKGRWRNWKNIQPCSKFNSHMFCSFNTVYGAMKDFPFSFSLLPFVSVSVCRIRLHLYIFFHLFHSKSHRVSL